MNPEELARHDIDRQLAQCGWQVQSRNEMNIFAALGVAVREFVMLTGEADYVLYAAGKAIGVVEAKPKGHPLIGVEGQSAKYVGALPPGVPAHGSPLPFSYESTGSVTQFTNLLEPDARSREVFTFHRPEELLRLVQLQGQVRDNLKALPPLDIAKLWSVQVMAIENLELSLAKNKPRSLIQMATGSGKTFTAVNACYRLIKFGGAKRVLFLVDRSNLGRQTYREFQQFVSPVNGYKFTDEYHVQLLNSNTIAPTSKVVITTIQRLYSVLKGEETFDESADEQSQFELATSLVKEPLPVVYNERIPIEAFDFVIVDECHRSIYNLWRQVLDYFDAFLVGLTATPTTLTIGFFNNNLVMEYGHEQAVADGVNVGFDVYRIQTQITEHGATLEREPGRFIPRRDRRTRSRRYAELDDDLNYEPNQLDRDVVAEDQIRLVIRTFRDRLFTEIFPGRTVVPKTLVFTKDDSHAEDVTRILREEFGKGNDFAQKITYRTGFILTEKEVKNADGSTGKVKDWKKVSDLKPDAVLAAFRNSYNPRIAVTVDMIATGTDVKPLECLLFMRNVKSAAYFEQMKGRGVRVIDVDALQSVTPDAAAKTHFVIVDAVGVAEQDKTCAKPLDRQPSVPFDKILGLVAAGVANDDLVSALAARLARLDRQLTDGEREQVNQQAGGTSLPALTADLLNSLDPDVQINRTRDIFGTPGDQQPTEEQLNQVQGELIAAALKPLHNPKLRDLLINLKRNHEQVIDEITQDTLLQAGFDAHALERAQSLITNFKEFIERNKDELEAIQILYSRPHRAGLRFRQVKDLAAALKNPPLGVTTERVWQAYQAAEPHAVNGKGGKDVVDLITLVRHALDADEPIIPFSSTVQERYDQWLEEQAHAGFVFTAEQRQWLDAIKDHVAKSLRIEEDDFDYAPFNTIGGLGRVHDLFGERLSVILDELNRRLAA
jgi:type I restriction enzyme, R subunit